MISGTASNGGNDLLAALPPREREGIRQQGEHIRLTRDEILGEPGARIHHVYFPADGFIALLAGVDGHDALAMGLVGSEGMLGAPLVLGLHTSPLRARVQGDGSALRIKAADFLRALAAVPLIERQLRRYVGARLEQFARTAVCASCHVVEARLACWLLMAHDRAHGDRFYLTHDRLARLLGVRRSGVSTAAGVLQGRRLIGYTRGHIAVLDRRGLEQAACGCYGEERGTVTPMIVAAGARNDPAGAVAGAPRPPAPQQNPALVPGLRVAPHRH